MTKDELLVKRKWFEDIQENFSLQKPDGGKLLHYTSLTVLFSILENDYLWASGTRFSNDSSEEALLKNEEFRDMDYAGDSFIVCFTDKEDCLSQWRGYCFNGGAAIEFDAVQPRKYSILHADYEKSRKFELDYNAPFPVLYVAQEDILPTSTSLSGQLLDDSNADRYAPWKARDIIPYFKDRSFDEESEWRLMFGNHNGELSKCVRFRTLKDGSKVPYMVVKAGNMGKNYLKCPFSNKDYSDDKLNEMLEKGINILNIPQGHNQEAIYYQVESAVNRFNHIYRKSHPEYQGNIIKLYCEGHLPIKRIMVAPTYNRDRIAEKIKRYCWSNYWLRNVDVTYSSIPYIPPSE